MPTAAQLQAVRTLVASAPDTALASLAAALRGAGSDLAPVLEMVTREQAARRIRDAAFAPVAPLFKPRADGVPSPVFSSGLLKAVWRDLTVSCGADLDAALADFGEWESDYDPPPPSFDRLCRQAARLLEQGAPLEYRGQDGGAEARELSIYLKLAPLARRAIDRMPDWLGKPTEERTAVLRLIFKDAVKLSDDSAPRLLEMLLGHLPEAAQILRPISLLTERAGDRYLADSELAAFGERLLAQAERHVEAVEAFDPRAGGPAARTAAAHAAAAGAILEELENSLDLARDGPWGRRLAAARLAMATTIETRLREAPRAVEQALPMYEVRLTGRMTRPSPGVAEAPDPRRVQTARGLLVLLAETRHAAATGGFGALRAQVAETLSDWLEVYADELVHMVNAAEAPDPAVAHQYLELAAEFLGCAENDKAAQIVRRRAAVAGSGAPSQDVA